MNDHKILYIGHWDEHQVAQKESTGTLLCLACSCSRRVVRLPLFFWKKPHSDVLNFVFFSWKTPSLLIFFHLLIIDDQLYSAHFVNLLHDALSIPAPPSSLILHIHMSKSSSFSFLFFYFCKSYSISPAQPSE